MMPSVAAGVTIAPRREAVHRTAMLGPMPFRLFANPRFGSTRKCVLPDAGFQRAKAEITAWDGYESTPLHDLPALAARRRPGMRPTEG